MNVDDRLDAIMELVYEAIPALNVTIRRSSWLNGKKIIFSGWAVEAEVPETSDLVRIGPTPEQAARDLIQHYKDIYT